MMHWLGKKIISIFIMVFLLQVGAGASAEERKDEWKDKKYAFGNVKIVLFEPSLDNEIKVDDLKQRVLFDMISTKMLNSESTRLAKDGWSIMTKEQLVTRIEGIIGENMSQLAQSDPARYEALVKEYTAFYCTNILQAKITTFKETGYTVPERLETYEVTKKVTAKKQVQSSDGKYYEVNETVTVPVTETRVVPAHYVKIGHAAMECTLVDTKTNQPVWKIMDVREAKYKEPDGMLERIMERAVGRLSDFKKNK